MNFLSLIGLCTLITIAVFLVVALFHLTVEMFDRIKRNYEIKHRFDKPPTAKCYCRDCDRHNNESNRCYKFDGWYTAPSWFCWDANPRKKEEQ